MMTWTNTAKDRSKETIINYNSDLSGDITIQVKDVSTKTLMEEARVDGRTILKFVAEYVRNQKIAKLEKAPWKKILGL